MADRSREKYRALCVPDLRLSGSDALWDGETTVTTTLLYPARPQDQGDSDLVLYANGQRSTESVVEVRAVRAGDIAPLGAAFAWRLSGDTYHRGRLAPTALWGWEGVEMVDSGASPSIGDVTEASFPFMLALADGSLLQFAQQERHLSSSRVVCYRRTETTSWGSPAVLYSRLLAGGASLVDTHPCAVAVPRDDEERVYAFAWHQGRGTDTANVRAFVSDDSGQTWAVASKAVLPEDIPVGGSSYQPGRLRVAYRKGQMVLMVGLEGQAADAADFRWHIRQYASAGSSLSFQQITTSEGKTGFEARYFDLITVDDAFLLAWIGRQNTSAPFTRLQVQRMADAFLPFVAGGSVKGENAIIATETAAQSVIHVRDMTTDEDHLHVETSAGSYYTVTDGDLAMCLHDDGAVYLYRRSVPVASEPASGDNEVHVFRSTTGGRTFRPVGRSDTHTISPRDRYCATVWRSQDPADYIRDLSVASWRGRMALGHRWVANTATWDDSLGVAYLGGYATVTMPTVDSTRDIAQVASWAHTWLPIELPGDTLGYVAGGSATESLEDGKLRITASANGRSYQAQPSTTVEDGYIGRLVVDPVSSSGSSTTEIGVRLRAASGSDSHDIAVIVHGTGFRVMDMSPGTPVELASVGPVVAPNGFDIVVALQDGDVDLWWARRATSADLVYERVSVTDPSNGGSSTNLVEWGVLGADTCTADFYEWHYTYGDNTGADVETMPDLSTPDDLLGAPYRREGVYVTDGIRLFAAKGPAVEGDEHHIGTTGSYTVDNVLPSVESSPRIGWQSETDTADAFIAVSYEHGTRAGVANQFNLSDTIFALARGANFRTAYLQGYVVGTGWTAVATLDFGVTWTSGGWGLSGATMKATGTGLGPYDGLYLSPDELKGWCVRPNTSASVVRRIAGNTEGTTDGKRTGRKAVLHMEGVDGTETAGATSIFSPSGLFIVNLLGVEVSAWRLHIPAQATADGRFKLGQLAIGPVAVLGTDYSWGRSTTLEHGSQIAEAEDGTYTVERKRPVRRVLRVGWDDGVDTTGASGDSPTPDYLMMSDSAGAEPVASERDVPFLVAGLYDQVGGVEVPVVYVPRLLYANTSALDVQTFIREGRDFVVGIIDSDVTLDTQMGEENESEVIGVSLTLREVN